VKSAGPITNRPQVKNLRHCTMHLSQSTWVRILPGKGPLDSCGNLPCSPTTHIHAVGQPIFITCRPIWQPPCKPQLFASHFLGTRFSDHGSASGRRHQRSYSISTIRSDAQPHRRCRFSTLMQLLKRYTAREGNRILHLTEESFWQDESFERLVPGSGGVQAHSKLHQAQTRYVRA
jgi:hypothetical protein